MNRLPHYRANEEGSRAPIAAPIGIDVRWIDGRRRFFTSDKSLFTRRKRAYRADLERTLARRFGLPSATIEPAG